MLKRHIIKVSVFISRLSPVRVRKMGVKYISLKEAEQAAQAPAAKYEYGHGRCCFAK